MATNFGSQFFAMANPDLAMKQQQLNMQMAAMQNQNNLGMAGLYGDQMNSARNLYGSMYGADTQANMNWLNQWVNSQRNNQGYDLGLKQNELGYYQTDKGLEGTQYGWNAQKDIAGIGADSQRYGWDTQYDMSQSQNDTQRYIADATTGTQRYLGDVNAGTSRYNTDAQVGAQRYGYDTGLYGSMYGADRGLQGVMAQDYGNTNRALIGAEVARYGNDTQLYGTGLQQAGETERALAGYGSAERINAGKNRTDIATARIGNEPAMANIGFQREKFGQLLPMFSGMLGGGGDGGYAPATIPYQQLYGADDTKKAVNRANAGVDHAYGEGQRALDADYAARGLAVGSPRAQATARQNMATAANQKINNGYQIPIAHRQSNAQSAAPYVQMMEEGKQNRAGYGLAKRGQNINAFTSMFGA